MVINHLEKLFVTNDAATILRELEVRKFVSNILHKEMIYKSGNLAQSKNVILFL